MLIFFNHKQSFSQQAIFIIIIFIEHRKSFSTVSETIAIDRLNLKIVYMPHILQRKSSIRQVCQNCSNIRNIVIDIKSTSKDQFLLSLVNARTSISNNHFRIKLVILHPNIQMVEKVLYKAIAFYRLSLFTIVLLHVLISLLR